MKRLRRRSARTSHTLLEPLERRELLSAKLVAGAPLQGIVLTSQRPQVISGASPAVLQGSGYANGTLVATITSGLTGAVHTTSLYSALNVAFGWDDGTVSVGAVAVHTGDALPTLGANGQPVQLFDLYISGGNHTAGNHAVYVAFWQWDGAAHPSLLSSLTFRATVAIVRNSPDGLTITGQAGQTFSGKVGTLPANVLPASLSSPQMSPVIIPLSSSTAEKIVITIAWGDGTSSDAALVKNTDGTWDILGTHTYADAGTYRIRVTGAESETLAPGYSGPPIPLPNSILVVYGGVDIAVISPTPPAIQTTQLNSFTATLGRIHLPTGVSPRDVPLTISWGDGSTGKATLVADSSGGYDIMGTHLYAKAGTYDVEIAGLVFAGATESPIMIFQTATISPVTFTLPIEHL
jgi:hypothetical protein